MISAATIAALEKAGLEYILGVRERSTKEVRNEVIEDDGVAVPLVIPHQKGETQLAIKETTLKGRRYVLCRNEEEARKDADRRAAILASLDAVITQLGLEQVLLVAHDASGPPAIDWALAQPERVAGLVLLNTYYCEMPTLRPPEVIWLFATPVIRNVARPVSQMFGNWVFRRMYRWQVGRFFRDADVRREFVPLLYQQFDATPSALPAFSRLNEDLLPMVRSRTAMIPKLREFKRPVRIIFGAADPYLNQGVARTFHEFLPVSELFLIPGARHFVQMDEPEQVARLILAMPSPGSKQS